MGTGWSKLVGGLAAIGIIFWTIKLILDTAGAAGLVVVLVTILTAAFAIGSERVAADLVSGVSLFISRPYQIDDIVSVAGHEGRVRSISVNQTTLESLYGDQIFIRNSDVVAGTIVNYSASPGHLLTAMVILPVTEDLNVAVDVVEKAIQNFSPEMTTPLIARPFPSNRVSRVTSTLRFGYMSKSGWIMDLKRPAFSSW